MTREEAIKVLNMVESHGLADEAKKIAIEALEQTRWIPASEEGPERDGRYLVTFKNHFIYMAFYAFDLYEADSYAFENKRGISGWYGYDEEYGYYEHDDVIAWMPLPQPYKGESEDDR